MPVSGLTLMQEIWGRHYDASVPAIRDAA